MNQPEVKRKSMFPFEATIEGSQGPQKAGVHKITQQGMLIEIFNGVYKIQSTLKIKWVLPGETATLEEECTVVKTYDHFSDEKKTQKKHLIEVHYKKLKMPNRDAISNFLIKLEAKIKKAQENAKKKYES